MSRSERPASPTSGLTRALREFLATEVAGGVVLLAAAAVALAWANSPFAGAYEDVWHTHRVVGIRTWGVGLDLRHWVNDGLMAVFFLVVGLEIKREFRQGELRERRNAALPIIAAIGGMVVPALLYAAFNAFGEGASGWGIPMATDIAFALGVLAVIAPNLPGSLRVFLLALAIVDDIGAIVVIALFYSQTLDPVWLAAAFGVALAAHLLWRLGVPAWPIFVIVGPLLWLAVHASGVHATIAGVVMGLLAPATSKLEQIEHILHPLSSLVIVPIFALANAGVSFAEVDLADTATSPVTLGVVVGLVAGKTIGITGAALLSTRLGIADLPSDVHRRQLAGVAALAGIGFTVSLFITELAFDAERTIADAKVGIFAASLLASALGAALLRGAVTARTAQ